MTKNDMISEILAAKKARGVTWAAIEHVPDPKGDRVKIIMNGKFLGYKKW